MVSGITPAGGQGRKAEGCSPQSIPQTALEWEWPFGVGPSWGKWGLRLGTPKLAGH